MRVTYHNGRGAKKGGGGFSSKHNDRNFDLKNADHIDPTRQDQNFYWHCFTDIAPHLTFEQAEEIFYEQHFRDFLSERNGKYIKQRHIDKVQTMGGYRRSRKSCPEEIIFAIGNVKDFKDLDTEKISKVYGDFRHWRKEKYPNVVSLNVALHSDEEGVPHIQERVVWIAHDNRGREMVNQGQALREMGVPLLYPEKKESRYNNSKITFTRDCREKFFEICRGYGIEIEEEPKERSEVGLSLTEYKVRQEELKLKELKNETAELKRSNHFLQVMKNDYKKWLNQASLEYEVQKSEIQDGKNFLKGLKSEIENERKNLQFIKNLVKICGTNEEKLKILVDIVKENDKGVIIRPKLDADGNFEINKKTGQPITEKVGGVFGDDLTVSKLASLVIPPPQERDLDDWNLLSEAEKTDRLAHQATDNYDL